MAIFTIGHSTRTPEAFVALLQEAGVRVVVDVRSAPSSRRYPQFDAEALAKTLAAFQIGYEHIPALGGHRKMNRLVATDLNAFWTNRSFHNYADYAMSAEFRAGLQRLLEIARAGPCAVMCAEAVWWRCHRRIIADYLMAEGETVRHILAPGQIKDAKLTEGARCCGPVLHYQCDAA